MVTDPASGAHVERDRLANSGRRGPVVLHVPRDLFAAEIPPIDPMFVNIARLRLRPDDIHAIATCSQMQNVRDLCWRGLQMG